MADYKSTVFLPKTAFPMRGELPKREPELLARWAKMGLYARLREVAKGRPKFVLHDGPPYANGNLHIGHALNKILKDIINRSQQMMGKDAAYVPGWDCHGLPIEWKIEEQYRERGTNQRKDQIPIIDFRRECREFAAYWIGVQKEEFKRLGVEGDWDNAYTTMDFKAEAQIARELMKFADNGLLYRGSKPVMWSVVEKTALAEAEVEYEDHVSDQVWVKFPVAARGAFGSDLSQVGNAADQLKGASIVIWTTTPWTIPGNRAISYSKKIKYGLYEVTDAPADNWASVGDRLILADALAESVMKQARVVAYGRLREVPDYDLDRFECSHPLASLGYKFRVPLLAGDHVTEDTGTGFVHTAPGHGRDDFEAWTHSARELAARGIDTRIPYTVDGDGFFTEEAPGFAGRRVLTETGEKGDANEAVIAALREVGMLIARARLTHQYPHSWRSKKPVIFRNTPQWFIAMDKDIDGPGDTLRKRALDAIKDTRWVPPQGENRITGMIESKPDWVVSRQRAWGVPITIFVNRESAEIMCDPKVNARIAAAFEREGADAWYRDGAAERFLRPDYDPKDWAKVDDILDVWFDSGSTHAFVLEPRGDWPASLYLEGSDQHRGWFHSSLLESCATRGRAPYDAVLTHGFLLIETGDKMSKSLGNMVSSEEVTSKSGADILRVWVAASEYTADLTFGPNILKQHEDTYRRLRNTLRYLCGALDGFDDRERVPRAEMPELERFVLHRLWELDALVRRACDDFDFHALFTALHNFCAVELSAFYFDIRKDSLYCDRHDTPRRRAARTAMAELYSCLTAWLAPILCFTAEEAWLARNPGEGESVHLRLFPTIPSEWRDDALAAKWRRVRDMRRIVTGALEKARADKKIGSSLEARPILFVGDGAPEVDWAEVCITSDIEVRREAPPAGAETLPDLPGVGALFGTAAGAKCARCWKVLSEVGTVPAHPELCVRCADAVDHSAVAAK